MKELLFFIFYSAVTWYEIRCIIWSVVECEKSKTHAKKIKSYYKKLPLRNKLNLKSLAGFVDKYSREFKRWLIIERIYLGLQSMLFIIYIAVGLSDKNGALIWICYTIMLEGFAGIIVTRLLFKYGRLNKYDRITINKRRKNKV